MARKKLGKTLLQSRAVQWLLSGMASFIIRLVYATNRIEKHFPDSIAPYMRGEQPAIFCFWHGRLLFQPFITPPRRKMFVLISNHNDGALITATIRWFGVGSVRGSRRKGGANALRELLALTERGDNIAITPDGPKGPFQQAADGAAYVASKTGYALIPLAFSASRHRRFTRSWDKFMLPKPFGRVVFVAAPPMLVAAEADEATLTGATQQLETELNRITAKADALCEVTS